MVPVLVFRSHPAADEFPSELTDASGFLLTAMVFMLGMAQRAYQDALTVVADEISARDKALCAAEATMDAEPWHARAGQERATHYPVMVIAALTPGQHRYRRACVKERERAALTLFDTSFKATWRVSAATRGEDGTDPDDRRVSEWVEKGLEGKTDALPKEVLDSCPWEVIGKIWRANKQKMERLDTQLKELDTATLQRLDVMPRVPDEREKATPPLVDQLPDALGSHLLPLDVASFLTLAIMSLSAAGVAYTDRGLAWPWDPALWATAGLVAVTLVYVTVMRKSLRKVGEALSKRLDRLTIPSLLACETLLSEGLVEQTTKPGGPLARELEKRLACLVGAEAVPLRHRVLGELHLWRALELERSSDKQRTMWDNMTKVGRIFPEAAPNAVAESDHERRLQSKKFNMYLELELAEAHLTKATAPGDADGVALLALARTYELLDRLSETDRGHVIEDLVLRALGPLVAGDNATDWLANLTNRSTVLAHKWLWPTPALDREELIKHVVV